MVTRYFVAAMRMVEAGGFDFVGHADKISYNAGICQPDLFRQGWFTDMLKEYFTLIAERGIMMEINTKAFFRKGILPLFVLLGYRYWLILMPTVRI